MESAKNPRISNGQAVSTGGFGGLARNPALNYTGWTIGRSPEHSPRFVSNGTAALSGALARIGGASR